MEVAFLFTMVVGFLLIGVPIAISLGLSSILFLLLLSDTSLASIAQSLYQAMAGHYTAACRTSAAGYCHFDDNAVRPLSWKKLTSDAFRKAAYLLL